MAAYKAIKVGPTLTVDELKKKPAPRSTTNPRDVELEKLVREVAAGPQSAVMTWDYQPAKPATARLAAKNAIARAGLVGAVFASSRPDYPGVLLFSRVPLSGRQGKGTK